MKLKSKYGIIIIRYKKIKRKYRNMQKIENMIKKHDYIFMTIVILIIISGYAVNANGGPNDSFWNFSNIYKMYEGEQIYADINIIITPLFFYIGEIFMYIFGSNYISYQIYNIITTVILFVLIYHLFRKLKIQKLTAMTYVIVSLIVLMPFYISATNYNVLAILFSLLGITNLIKNELNTKTAIFQGIIAFLVFMSKQNIGVFYIIGLILYAIISKKSIKQLLISAITFLIGVIFTIIAFLINGNLYSFIDYAFLGISEFATKNVYIQIISILIFLIYIAIILYAFIIIFNKKIDIEKEIKENVKILLSFTIPFAFIVYPIFNTYHLILAGILPCILLIYSLTVTIKQAKLKKITIIGTICLAIFSIYLFTDYIRKITNEDYYFKGNHPYNGMLIDEEQYNEMQEVCDFVEENNANGIDVKILSHRAMWYLVQLHQFNGELDLPFHGNLGKDGEDGLIETIKNLKNTKVLILKEGETRAQESEKVEDFIKQNYEKVEEISMFDVYYIK